MFLPNRNVKQLVLCQQAFNQYFLLQHNKAHRSWSYWSQSTVTCIHDLDHTVLLNLTSLLHLAVNKDIVSGLPDIQFHKESPCNADQFSPEAEKILRRKATYFSILPGVTKSWHDSGNFHFHFTFEWCQSCGLQSILCQYGNYSKVNYIKAPFALVISTSTWSSALSSAFNILERLQFPL